MGGQKPPAGQKFFPKTGKNFQNPIDKCLHLWYSKGRTDSGPPFGICSFVLLFFCCSFVFFMTFFFFCPSSSGPEEPIFRSELLTCFGLPSPGQRNNVPGPPRGRCFCLSDPEKRSGRARNPQHLWHRADPCRSAVGGLPDRDFEMEFLGLEFRGGRVPHLEMTERQRGPFRWTGAASFLIKQNS